MRRALWQLALKSLWNRKLTVGLTLLSIALCSALLLGVERLRDETQQSFNQTISGTDLVVGARSGSVQMMLYAVFRMGQATHNIHWESFQMIRDLPRVRWAVPLSLGDSHAGYPVLGTDSGYFRHYRFGNDQPLALASGEAFTDTFSAVIGAEVAEKLGYRVGDELVIAHGTGPVSFMKHDNLPFTVTGVLKTTGTPVDRTIHIPLEGFTAIHIGWSDGSAPQQAPTARQLRGQDLTPKSLTAVLVGLENRLAVFPVQRSINNYRGEPLQAVMPGVALQELWQLVGTAERAMLAISVLVVVLGLTGMLVMMLAGLQARRREMAILRAVGASPRHLFGLLVTESLFLTVLGLLAGVALLYGGLAIARPLLREELGLLIEIGMPGAVEWMIAGSIVAAGTAVGIVPGLMAYRRGLVDGLNGRD
ncbi:MAG: ABC transporter permease [Halothiobacillaceae bacterium]